MKTFGNYSTYKIFNSTIYIAGQVGVNEDLLAPQTLKEQFDLIIKKIEVILKDSNSNFDNILAIRVYLTDMNLFAEFNDLYSKVFTSNLPVRECVGVSALPPVAKNDNKLLIEISMIAKTVDDPKQ